MIGTDWHIDRDDLASYADGRAGPAQLASVEAHLGRCDRCRAALSGRVAAGSAASTGDDPVWAGIADRIDGGNRLLRRWPRLATVSLASPPLVIATTLVAGLLVVLVIAARLWSARYATATLVTLGPITPLVAAHVAFGPRVDPAGRMAAAAPIASGRVAALRALAATLLACVAGLAVTPLTTLPAADVVVWLLPALAGTALAVAIGTFVDAAGDDTYYIPKKSAGGGDMNSIGLFCDQQGADTYHPLAHSCLGAASTSNPRGDRFRTVMPTIGAFVDLGGADRYPAQGSAKNNTQWHHTASTQAWGFGYDTQPRPAVP